MQNTNIESLSKIFNTDDKDEMRGEFKKLLISHFESELEEMGLSLFDPNKIEEWIDEAFQEVIAEIKVEFKEELKKQMLKLFENSDFEKLLNLSKKI